MALIACPECHREISELASDCPQCGFPVAAQRRVPHTPTTEPTKPDLAQGRSTGHLVAAIVSGVVGWSWIVFMSGSVYIGVALIVVAAWLFGKWLREPEDEFQRHLAIAADPDADGPLLDQIGQSSNALVRMQVALNPNTAAATLERLANDSDSEIANEAESRLALEPGCD